MEVANTLFAFESVFLLGQSLMVVSILLLKDDLFGIYRPLLLFFTANSINQLPAILEPFNASPAIDGIVVITEMLTIPAFLILAPALWLYVKGLTSEVAHKMNRKDLIHFIPCGVAILVCFVLLISPIDVRETILGDGESDTTILISIITITIMVLMVVWALQVVFYVKLCIQRVLRYKHRLKDIFANTEGKELNWIIILMLLLILSVVVFIPDFMVGFPMSLTFIPATLDIVLFWFLAVWALRQKPGFLSEGKDSVTEYATRKTKITANTFKKYEKSALTEADMERIAAKINKAMKSDKLFLEPNLSLGLLSQHISVPANYVSQTLNSCIGESFFDFINRCRVKHTQPLLANSNETVLNIAVNTGFNSRSSFYKAFKRETNMTPIEFRKQQQM